MIENAIKVIDLFSGIGGFSYGLEKLCGGFETVVFCEQDKFCQQVLAKHWPHVPIHDDIKTFGGDCYALGSTSLVCGGFPCQPYSSAGKRRGAADDRALWPEMLRVIREVQPDFVIGENVAGIISMELDQVLSDLENSGYSCQAFVIPACAIDAPHRRDRVWILSHCNPHRSAQQQREHQRSDEFDRGSEKRVEARTTLPNDAQSSNGPHHTGSAAGQRTQSGESASAGDVADAQRFRCEQVVQSISGRSTSKRTTDSFVNSSFARRRARWESEPSVGRVVNGLPHRVDRLRSLGNAVVPQVVAEIGKAILEIATTTQNKNRTN